MLTCLIIYFKTLMCSILLAFMAAATAEDPAGEWTLRLIYETADWEDPCPYWDEDGNAWLLHSLLGAGPLILHRMTPDGLSITIAQRTIIRLALPSTRKKEYPI